eukprot:745840-Hanusia_phi.AAC.2
MCQVEGIIPSSSLASQSVEELTWHQFRDMACSDTCSLSSYHPAHSVLLTYDDYCSNIPADFILTCAADDVSNEWLGAGLCMDDWMPQKNAVSPGNDFQFPFTEEEDYDDCYCCTSGNGIVCTYEAPPPVSFNTIRNKEGRAWRVRGQLSQQSLASYSKEIYLWRRQRNRNMGLQGLLFLLASVAETIIASSSSHLARLVPT